MPIGDITPLGNYGKRISSPTEDVLTWPALRAPFKSYGRKHGYDGRLFAEFFTKNVGWRVDLRGQPKGDFKA